MDKKLGSLIKNFPYLYTSISYTEGAGGVRALTARNSK